MNPDSDKKIKGGYVLQPRKLDESQIVHAAPIVREIWLYLVRKVNHKPFKNLERGQGLFHFSEIQEDLSWTVGYRKMRYSKPQITKVLRRLREEIMIETTKATAGMVITIINYDKYQNPENYEGNSERTAKATRRQREGNALIIQECNNEKKERINTLQDEDFLIFWKNYPKKIGKLDAQKAWKKLNGTRPGITTLLKAIETQKQSMQWQKENGQYIPHPSTWLNKGQWEDEIKVGGHQNKPTTDSGLYREI